MADSTRTAKLIVSARDDSSAGLSKAKDNVTGFNKALKDMGKEALGTAARFLGPAGLVIALKGSIDAAMEAEVIMAKTEAVIKSTGGVADLTAKDIGDLADSLSNMSGVDDELIQSAENVMLTFTRIGKDVFPRAMESALNMSTALGTDLQGSVIQLGKALQDPILGVNALRRVGVNFDADAKKLIKTMVQMGDTAGAQAFILKELETEFGGVAKAAGDTTTGKFQKFSVAIGNLGEAIGRRLLPVLAEFAIKATDFVNNIDVGIKVLEGSATPVERQQNLIIGLTNAYGENSDAVRQAKDALAGLMAEQERAMEAGENEAQIRRNLTAAFGEAKTAIDNVTLSEKELAEQTDKVNKQMDQLKFIVGGVVGKELKDYSDKQSELRVNLAELNLELDKLESSHGKVSVSQQKQSATTAELDLWTLQLAEKQTKLAEETDPMKQAEMAVQIEKLQGKLGGATEATTTYIDNSKKMAEVRTEIYETVNALSELEIAHREKVAHMIFDMAAEQLAMDGLTQQEVLGLRTVAIELGIFDEAGARAMQNVLDATIQLSEGGGIGNFKQSVVGAANELLNFNAAAASVPRNIDITFSIHTEGTIPNIPTGGPGSPPIAMQFGGPVSGGRPYLVGERGPEMFVPGAGGFVMDNADTQKMLSLLQSIATGIGRPSVTVNAGMGADANAIVQAIDVGLGRRARLMHASGAATMGT